MNDEINRLAELIRESGRDLLNDTDERDLFLQQCGYDLEGMKREAELLQRVIQAEAHAANAEEFLLRVKDVLNEVETLLDMRRTDELPQSEVLSMVRAVLREYEEVILES